MAEYVLDASIVMAWCFEDEANVYADAVLDHLIENNALVPSLWPLEVANVMVVAERRKRITKAEGVHFLELLRQLPIEVDLSTEQRIFQLGSGAYTFNIRRSVPGFGDADRSSISDAG